MDWETLARELAISTPSRIVLLVVDGLGDLPVEGKTALEKARTPNLDRLAAKGAWGRARRARRSPSSENGKRCRRVNAALQPPPGLRISLFPGKEHRFVVRFTSEGLSDALSDADPQKDHKPRAYAKALSPEAKRAAEIVHRFLDDGTGILSDLAA